MGKIGGNMKRIIVFLICIIYAFSLSACSNITKDNEKSIKEIKETIVQNIVEDFENDGVLKYFYDEVSETYHITGKMVDLSSSFYIPLSFNGNKISELGHVAVFPDGTYETFSFEYDVENLYLSDNIDNYYSILSASFYAKNIFFAQVKTEDVYNKICSRLNGNNTLFFNSQIFEKFKVELVNSEANVSNEKEEHYKITFLPFMTTTSKGAEVALQRANVIFYYNNETAENNTFLVDNKNGAFLIAKPTYDPVLEGYTFAGWYKEPECINAWDFEKYKTPELEYDEQGELIFKETSLYAKWV